MNCGRRQMKKHQKPMIQLCPRCGKVRASHVPNPWQCDVDDAVLDALRKFKAANGRTWKAKLCAEWADARAMRDMEDGLARAKTMIGPGCLGKVVLE
jgi:hypothetical protein